MTNVPSAASGTWWICHDDSRRFRTISPIRDWQSGGSWVQVPSPPPRGVHEMPPAVFMKPQMKSSIWAACSLACLTPNAGPPGKANACLAVRTPWVRNATSPRCVHFLERNGYFGGAFDRVSMTSTHVPVRRFERLMGPSGTCEIGPSSSRLCFARKERTRSRL
jgi:hypothetical protein